MDFTKFSIRELNDKLKKKDTSASELTDFYISQIEKKDDEIKAFTSLNFDEARKKAKEIDKKIKEGKDIDVLAGIPSAIKDNILIDGITATASSNILKTYKATYDATVIKKLKEKDAIFLGKTNMDEFAMGSSTETSAFFKTKNPHDTKRVPGGSSGGSAAAVSSDQAVYALGSDTGGSIRQPASFCGAIGLKPTYGAVSRYGLIAMASSLDQIGPFSKRIDDAKIVYDAIVGKDQKDATSIKHEKAKPKGIKGLKIGVPKEYFTDGMDKGVEESVRKAISDMEKAGAKIEEISLPSTEYALSVYYIVMPAEVSSNMARYDGIKYGYSKGDHDLLSVYLRSRSEGLGAEVKRRIMLGTYVLSAGYYDAYYKKAQQARTKITDDFKKAFEKVDVIACPTTPTTSFKFGEKTDDPLSMYLEDIFTVPINLAGIPAISMPCGKANDMPVGLQLMAPWFSEEQLFETGADYEKIRGEFK